MTPTNTLSREDWTALRTAICDHLGGWPINCARTFTAADASPEEIDDAGIFSTLDGKAGYLDWVRTYKTLIKTMSATARTLKAERNTSDVWAQAQAQERLAWLRGATSMAIRQRHLGKTWSRSQRRQQLEDAA